MKTKLKVIIDSILHKAGIPTYLKGYRYLRDAIMISYNCSYNKWYHLLQTYFIFGEQYN